MHIAARCRYLGDYADIGKLRDGQLSQFWQDEDFEQVGMAAAPGVSVFRSHRIVFTVCGDVLVLIGLLLLFSSAFINPSPSAPR